MVNNVAIVMRNGYWWIVSVSSRDLGESVCFDFQITLAGIASPLSLPLTKTKDWTIFLRNVGDLFYCTPFKSHLIEYFILLFVVLYAHSRRFKRFSLSAFSFE